MNLTLAWNKFVYKLWSPIYDPLLDRFFFSPARRESIRILAPRRGERILIPGVGTGADLPLLPEGVRVLGIDLSADMLVQARRRLPLPGREIELREGDVQVRQTGPGTCDAAILHLILSVAPDGAACFRETLAALRPGGRAVIFDKFLPETGKPSLARRLLRLPGLLFGTDITRRLSDVIPASFGKDARAYSRGRAAGPAVRVLSDTPSLLGGAYRIVLVEKPHVVHRP
jgi:phosphatidylethanolamine/phosphatidyl-N-methylethanolamine N-methyltransferase